MTLPLINQLMLANKSPFSFDLFYLSRGGFEMSKRYQNGYLRCAKRKSGAQYWEFLWRENNDNGKRVRRTAIIGTVAQLPTEQLARVAANALRVNINSDSNRCCMVPISISDLIDHYIRTDLSCDAGWHSHATRTIYSYFLQKWIRPPGAKFLFALSELSLSSAG